MYHRQKRELAGGWWGQPELADAIKNDRPFTPISMSRNWNNTAWVVWSSTEYEPKKYRHIQFSLNGVVIN